MEKDITKKDIVFRIERFLNVGFSYYAQRGFLKAFNKKNINSFRLYIPKTSETVEVKKDDYKDEHELEYLMIIEDELFLLTIQYDGDYVSTIVLQTANVKDSYGKQAEFGLKAAITFMNILIDRFPDEYKNKISDKNILEKVIYDELRYEKLLQSIINIGEAANTSSQNMKLSPRRQILTKEKVLKMGEYQIQYELKKGVNSVYFYVPLRGSKMDNSSLEISASVKRGVYSRPIYLTGEDAIVYFYEELMDNLPIELKGVTLLEDIV